MNLKLKTAHKYLGLSLMLIWILQAVTGVLISFRWELDDAILGGKQHVLNLDALSSRVLAIQSDQRYNVSSVWASGSYPDRYDIYAQELGGDDLVFRIDGRGNVLRQRGDGQKFANGGLYDSATTLHASLFLGGSGHLIIALSGLLLLSNLAVGLKLAWPRAGQWRRALFTRAKGPVLARLYGWHRRLGLWLVLPAMIVVFMGTLLALSDHLEDWMGWVSPRPNDVLLYEQESNWQENPVSPARAINTALNLYPTAKFSGFYPPDDREPWYTVRLLSAEEPAQKYGKTAVLVGARTGQVLVNQAAVDYSAARRMLNSLFPLHTGQILGMTGRLLGLIVGLWLLTMLLLGFSIFWKRRT